MEKFKLVRPSAEHELKAKEYINEFIINNSEIHGVGGLNKYMHDYNSWLENLEKCRNIVESDSLVPSESFFLIRESDKKIIGMIDIRLKLNEFLKRYGGNIGYSIRPSERRKGYNKINLYLALKFCQEKGVTEVLLDCNSDNYGSAATIISLGGKLVKEEFNEIGNCMMKDFIIDVNSVIELNKDKYERYCANDNYNQ